MSANHGFSRAGPVRWLAIGNSLSGNATDYLPQLAKSQFRELTLSRANPGGWSLQMHWEAVERWEADPADPKARPYSDLSLEQLLTSQPWDLVTLQQHSTLSLETASYQPYSNHLADYVRRHAPRAKLGVIQTWAFREEDPIYAERKFTQDQMQQQLIEAYALVAQQIDASLVIPAGKAFQNVRHDPRWRLQVEQGWDPKAFKYPQVPKQTYALCRGWRWDEWQSPQVFGFDGKHCTPSGRFLGSLVSYHALYGELRADPFVPPEVPADEAEIIIDVARKTVLNGMQAYVTVS